MPGGASKTSPRSLAERITCLSFTSPLRIREDLQVPINFRQTAVTGFAGPKTERFGDPLVLAMNGFQGTIPAQDRIALDPPMASETGHHCLMPQFKRHAFLFGFHRQGKMPVKRPVPCFYKILQPRDRTMGSFLFA
jgi:hypothetical protein